ncbi:MAG: hypothetical protein M3P33_01890 [bacterium]|nr:hypothetical protein [bacterium]
MKRQLFKSSKLGNKGLVLPVKDYQFHDKVSNLCFIVAFVIIVIEFLFVWINFSQIPPQIPLYFQKIWGVAQLAERQMIWLQPGLMLIFFLLNYGISIFNAGKEPLTARILGVTVLICSVMSVVSVWNIVQLVVVPKLWF